MNQQKNQESVTPGFLEGIGNEVSPESAPLLQFITKYAWAIAGGVIILLLVLGGMGIWRWYQSGKMEDARTELSRINATLEGAAREGALQNLADTAPESMKFYVFMTLGQCARENGNLPLAVSAYAKAAAIDSENALGMAALLGEAGSLLEKGDAGEAVALLQKLVQNQGNAAISLRMKELLAEAAEQAGNIPLAIQTYQELGNQIKTADGGYYRARSEELENGGQKANVQP